MKKSAFLLPILLSSLLVAAGGPSRKTYIVHVANSQMPALFLQQPESWYAATLKSVSESAEMLYTYSTAIHGFSTRLTDVEAVSLAARPGILSVLPEQRYELHTTRTPEFIGIQDNSAVLLPDADSESDIIVGVLDTGVWPERKSYNDDGMGPAPAGWKGGCEIGTNFTASACNKKLIGARFFAKGYEAAMGPIDESKEFRSPRDDQGHGTHTSSTAAGTEVEGANLFGYAEGKARGMAKNARVAVYKVCWSGGCYNSDVLAGMDKAIADGVNVLSLSLGGSPSGFYSDIIAIGAFAATEKGILVSCSAGNSGPRPGSVTNVAPWITTVGAGTIDRDFPASVSLGNGKKYYGVSLYSGSALTADPHPIVYAANVSNSTNGNFCIPRTLNPQKVANKIVLCDRGLTPGVLKGQIVKDAGGLGMVVANTKGEEILAEAHLIPATSVGQKAGDEIKKYLSTDPNPTAAIIFEGTKVGIKPAPVVAAFSSRGPNTVVPDILKPDLIAPGVNILAGWTAATGPSGFPIDHRVVEFNIISGTSMSCPHISGLAAFLKARHQDWSPAAIRSALMTTSYDRYEDGTLILDKATIGKTATPFDYGAGHVNAKDALNPGLVYDITVDDYLDFLCALNYTASQIYQVARRNYTCNPTKKYNIYDLNYPSFAATFNTTQMSGGEANAIKFTRTLTSVGGSGTYVVSISSADSNAVTVSVDPDTLSFSAANEKKSYAVTVTPSPADPGTNIFGRLVWSDGNHTVASPMAFTWT